MEFADQSGLAQATSWVSSGNAEATQTDAAQANAAPEPQQQQQQQQGVLPAGDQPAAPAAPEDLTPYRELVDGLGGLEGARQFDGLYKALLNPSQDFSEVGGGINKALQQLLGNDHYGALAMALHSEFGELLAEQYVADHPEWLQAQMERTKPAETSDDDDYDDYGRTSPGQPGRESQMSPREQELTNRLAEMENRLNQFQQGQQQTAEQRFRQGLEKDVFGSVIDKTFAQLEGWEQPELQQAMRMAMSEFSLDQKAKEAFDGAASYLRTKQPLQAGHMVRAQNAFQTHLKNAIELIDLKRQAGRKAAAPVEPTRTEFGAGAPTQPNTQQPATNRELNAQFWDANDLHAGVRRRLAGQQGAAPV